MICCRDPLKRPVGNGLSENTDGEKIKNEKFGFQVGKCVILCQLNVN
jgi:hypothetical protein